MHIGASIRFVGTDRWHRLNGVLNTIAVISDVAVTDVPGCKAPLVDPRVSDGGSARLRADSRSFDKPG